jgi:hypothetical protein
VPIVTAWQSYTPILTNFTSSGTNASNSGFWRRVGDTMQIIISTRMGSTGTSSGVFYWGLPTGYTVDGSKIPPAGSGIRQAPGSIVWYDRSANQFVNSVPSIDQGQNAIWSIVTGNGLPQNLDNTVVPSNADDSFSLSITVPISQWSSGTTTLADRAVEEYGWNNNLANADSTTKSTDEGYGPTGARIPNVSTSNKIKRVWFQSPILETDSLQLEIKWGGQWLPIGNTGLGPVNSTTLGIAIDDSNITSTSCDVVFGSAGFGASTGVAAGGWATLGGSDNYKWRVRKVSSGAQVGYPISTKNIVGAKDGVAPVTGMLGEVVRSQGSTSLSASTGTVNVTSIQIGAGTWILSGFIGSTLGADSITSMIVSDASGTGNTLTGITNGHDVGLAAQSTTGKVGSTPMLAYYTSSPRTIFLNFFRLNSVTATVGFHLSATRIA